MQNNATIMYDGKVHIGDGKVPVAVYLDLEEVRTIVGDILDLAIEQKGKTLHFKLETDMQESKGLSLYFLNLLQPGMVFERGVSRLQKDGDNCCWVAIKTARGWVVRYHESYGYAKISRTRVSNDFPLYMESLVKKDGKMLEKSRVSEILEVEDEAMELYGL